MEIGFSGYTKRSAGEKERISEAITAVGGNRWIWVDHARGRHG
jgi:hypothetical protein